jgi:hypothetical protein
LHDSIYHDPTKTNDKNRQIYRYQPRPGDVALENNGPGSRRQPLTDPMRANPSGNMHEIDGEGRSDCR